VVAATGVAVGARQSLPNDPTAAAKHSVEQRRQVLTGATATDGKTHLTSARRRLQELAAVLRGVGTNRTLSPETSATVHRLLRAWASEAAAGSSALLSEARRGSSEASRALVDFTDDQSSDFQMVLANLPDPRLRTLAGSALSFMAKVDVALGVPPPATPAQPVGPTSTLSAPATTGSAPAAPTGTPSTGHAPRASSPSTGATTSPSAPSAARPGARSVPSASTPSSTPSKTETAIPPIAQLQPLPLPTSIPPLPSPLIGTATEDGSGTP
jgi:hypothetical protein